MRPSWHRLLLAPLLLAACGNDTTSVSSAGDPPDPAQRYRATATVLQNEGEEPELCLSAVGESYPPVCGGPEIVGWDWEEVHEKESASGTTWGTYDVIGTWDGERFTLTGPPEPPTYDAELPRPDLSTPCEPPADGWAVVDPGSVTFEDQQAAQDYAVSQPGYAGSWVDTSATVAGGGTGGDEDDGGGDRPVGEGGDPADEVFNVRFTDDLERHEAELRKVWGGALCVVDAARSLRELHAIQEELVDELDTLSASADETVGRVDVQVVVATDELQRELDERYGEGVVHVHGALEPVD